MLLLYFFCSFFCCCFSRIGHTIACSCHGPSRDSMWRHPPYHHQQSLPLPPPPTACISSRPVLRRPASFSGIHTQKNSKTFVVVVVVVGAGNLNFDLIRFLVIFFLKGYGDQGSMAGSDWNPRGSVRMSTMKRTSIPSFATLHEVSNVDEAHHTDGRHTFIFSAQTIFHSF